MFAILEVSNQTEMLSTLSLILLGGISPTKTMMLVLLGLLVLFDSGVLAQSSPTSTAPATTHTVTVGLDSHRFNPETIRAKVGDTVLFEFYPANHSVARAEYKFPCIPIENTGPRKVGFWSGFQPVERVNENLPTWSLTVNDTAPTFFYCSAEGSCIPNVMIGVINPNATRTLDVQKAFVRNATIQLSPGEQNPLESTAKPTTSTTSALPTETPSSIASAQSGTGLSGGVIAGIVVGAVAFVAIAGLAFYLCGRNRTLASVLRYSNPPPRPSNIPPIPYSSPAMAAHSPEMKPSFATASRNANSHDWQAHSPSHSVGSTGPEMSTFGRSMSPNNSPPMYGSAPNNTSEDMGQIGHFRQASPIATPWSPGGFNHVPLRQSSPNQEATAGQQFLNPRSISPGFANHQTPHPIHGVQVQESSQPFNQVHELDARPSAPSTSTNQTPPHYSPRNFSFSASATAPQGVEKVVRD